MNVRNLVAHLGYCAFGAILATTSAADILGPGGFFPSEGVVEILFDTKALNNELGK